MEKLFKHNQEKISSQEELHDFMRVTSPRLWMLLGAIALLLVGFIAYAATATMENTMPLRLEVQSFDTLPEYRAGGGPERLSLVSGKLPSSLANSVDPGMKVRLDQYEGKVAYMVEDADTSELILTVEMDGGFVPLPDGTYDAELILESTTPISFLWN